MVAPKLYDSDARVWGKVAMRLLCVSALHQGSVSLIFPCIVHTESDSSYFLSLPGLLLTG